MTDDQISDAIDSAVDDINASPAMNPSRASQQDSVEFLDGVIEALVSQRDQIKREMQD